MFRRQLLKLLKKIFSTKYLFYNYWKILFKTLLFIYYYVDISDEVFFDKLILTIQEKCQKYDNVQCYKELNKIGTIINNQYKYYIYLIWVYLYLSL